MKKSTNPIFTKLRLSRKALAIPMTFMILFVTTMSLIGVMYYFSIERVNSQGATLKISAAKQDMISLDQSILSAAWQPGSSRVIQISDSSGKTNIQPLNNSLAVSIADGLNINEIIYNQTIGQVSYELPYTNSADIGLYLKGDSRTVVNQSGSVMTQLYITNGVEHPEIQLCYRPVVSYTTAGQEDNKTVNNMRIYIINLNTSDAMSLYGQLPLKVSCESTQITKLTYNATNSTQTLYVTSVLNGVTGQVSVPISSTANGSIINVETVVCNLKIQRCVI